jgi:glyoxylase-like metal-dependent hydrolase (beta-lactamase superfamily II)
LTALVSASCSPGRPSLGEARFLPGPINTLVMERNGRRLVVYGDASEAFPAADQVLFTHHRRDVVRAGRRLVEEGALAVVPAAEQSWFSDPLAFWRAYSEERFHDYAQQSTKILASPLKVGRGVRGGEKLEWEGLAIEVVDTPGYTRGAVSYLFETAGARIACIGDLMYGDGQIFDLFSLQDAIPETDTRGYHGYAARAADVIASLERVLAWKPDVLVPARGPLVTQPEAAAGRLTDRLRRLFRAYYRTDALRWYWGDDHLRRRARRVLGDEQLEWMPMATRLRQTPPHWMRKQGTSRLLLSASGDAFLIDCGTDAIRQWLRDLQREGLFRRLAGVFITHYHDDHTDRVQALAEEQRCPVYAGPEVADILENPQAYRMPAETNNAIRPVQVLSEGQTLRWNEFQFTYTYFPGQAIYHGGLKAERDGGGKLIFVGDSFSPTGLDDYCILNRHLLHPGFGHFRCLDILRQLDSEYMLVNQHIEPTFRYDLEQIGLMEKTLEEKRAIIAESTPWPDPNFGVDEQWVRLYPYGAEVSSGQPFELWAVVFNHTDETTQFRITPRLPVGWSSVPESVTVSPGHREEGRAAFKITAPRGASGLAVLVADVAFDEWELREWVEAIVELR